MFTRDCCSTCDFLWRPTDHLITRPELERAEDAAGIGVEASGNHGGRPPAFDPDRYKQRNMVERAINKLKGHRAVATRYDCDYMFRGTIDVASIRIWLRDPVP